jgi:hypothetical protein
LVSCHLVSTLAALAQSLAAAATPWTQEEMAATELFLLGTRFLVAAEQLEQPKLHAALSGLGERALSLSMQG